MKLNNLARLALAFLLLTIAVIAMCGIFKYHTSIMLVSLSMHSILALLALLGSVSLLVFACTAIKAILKNKIATKRVGIISITLSIVAAIFLLTLGYGFIKDLFGVTCIGFFGVRQSCASSSMLLLHIGILHPFSLVAIGLASLLGTYDQFLKR